MKLNATRLTWSLALAAFLFMAAMPSNAGAQIASTAKRYTDPLTIEIEGDFDFQALLGDESLDDNDNKQYSLTFGPAVGLFVVKGLQLGLCPAVTFTKLDTGDGDTTYVVGGVSLFMRYVVDLHSIVYPFFGVRMGAFGG
jgi:hypothetical protein